MSFFVKSDPSIIMSANAFKAYKQHQKWVDEAYKLDSIRQIASRRGENVKVAVIDTGIDVDHVDLQDNIAGGVNFAAGARTLYNDRNGHGTHCAGIIAATDDSKGITGVAPRAQLYAVKVLNNDGTGDNDAVTRGVEWCISHKMDVISMSLGSAASYSPLRIAIKRAIASKIIVVAAAGNEDNGNDQTVETSYPACYADVISVAAVNKDGKSARFSNDHPEVDISAPGVDIFSTYPNNKYAVLSGTSMATPFIAGLVALIKGENSNFTADDVKYMLYDTAIDKGKEGRDQSYGWGIASPSGVVALL